MNLEGFFTSAKAGGADLINSLIGKRNEVASQIKSYKDNTDIKIISPRARVQLFRALNDLKETSDNFIKDLEVK